MRRKRWVCAAVGSAMVAALGAGVAGQTPAYQPPRTPWGDPDLQGKWPGTEMVGVPMQRDPKLGARNVLTEEEFVARRAQFERQAAQDEADFDLETATSTPGGDVGGPVSPPPHWLERGRPQYQASLIVDPPDGRMPPLTTEAQQRAQALAAARKQRGPGRFLHRPQPVRPLHHARHRRFDPAGHLQQRQRDRPGARLRRHPQRDDSRDARRPAGSPAAGGRQESSCGWATRADTSMATRWSSRPGISIRARPALASTAAAGASATSWWLPSASPGVSDTRAALSGDRQRSENLDAGLDLRISVDARRRLRLLRVRVPRGQLLPLQHPERPPGRRESCGRSRQGSIVRLADWRPDDWRTDMTVRTRSSSGGRGCRGGGDVDRLGRGTGRGGPRLQGPENPVG